VYICCFTCQDVVFHFLFKSSKHNWVLFLIVVHFSYIETIFTQLCLQKKKLERETSKPNWGGGGGGGGAGLVQEEQSCRFASFPSSQISGFVNSCQNLSDCIINL
jgi:hypothetical protein